MLIPAVSTPPGPSDEDDVSTPFRLSRFSPFSNGVDDDLPSFVACVTACFDADGGTVLCDVPQWWLGSVGGFWDGANTASNVKICEWNDNTVITVNCSGITPMTFANMTTL